MRVTNDIKNKIHKEISQTFSNYLEYINKDISDEELRLEIWRNSKIKSLKEQLEPIVLNWAKLLKKNYSSYDWTNAETSSKLSENFFNEMFKDSWDSPFPKVTSKKLNKLIKQKDRFKERISLLVTDTCIKTSYIKSLDELNTLIYDAKKQVTKEYEDCRSY